MLAVPFRREVYFGNMFGSRMQCVPRCLFGPANPKDTIDLLKDALDMERTNFIKRWGFDPCSENKENIQRKFDTTESRSPRKSRGLPYTRQSNIHDYWRSRKIYDNNRKSLVSKVDAIKMQPDTQKTSN